MLAGLIFATEDAEDRADALAATLPFGGTTLIEYQARLLAAVGATHILVAVSRVTPALLGAVSRIGGRGGTVDVVRSAGEAASKVHPLADVIVVADGLVTTDAVIEWMASEGHEALLVAKDGDGTPGIERVDAGHSWAGLARVHAKRLAEVAEMPEDYDFQSTLLRQASQAGAFHLLLPAGTGRTRHGVERSAAALLRRSKSVLAALGDRRTAWIDRYFFTPVTGWLLPHLVARSVPGWAMMALGGVGALGVIACFGFRWAAGGLAMTMLAATIFGVGSMLSWLRAEDVAARLQERAVVGVAALGIFLAASVAFLGSGQWGGPALAAVLVTIATLIERVPAPRRRWGATAPVYPLVVLPFAALGWTGLGLAVATGYALATLTAAIEGSRKQA